MLSSLLSPAQPQGRISQLLPSVKCSTCHQPVPLAELGEHTCTAPPPVPDLPKPAITPQEATALLPDRLQGRVTTPDTAHQRLRSTSSARLQISTQSPSQSSFQPRSSPLARGSDDPQPPFAARLRSGSNAPSPATARPLGSFSASSAGPPPPAPIRSASASAGGAYPFPAQQPPPRIGSTPPQPPRPPQSYSQPQPPRIGSTPPQPPRVTSPAASFTSQNRPQYTPTQPPPSLRPGPSQQAPPTAYPRTPASGPPPNAGSEAFVPPAERGVDTKVGGEAGMAGVGRRGFAAAARAAMFVTPPHPPYGGNQNPNGYSNARRPNAPQFLDIDAVSRSASTPPLSDGSGYSGSPSPGPISPIPQVDPRQNNYNNGLSAKPMQSRTPSPGIGMTTPTPPKSATPTLTPALNTAVPPGSATASPISGRLPFFEKLRGRLGGAGTGEPEPPPTSALPPVPPHGRSASTASASTSASVSRNGSRSAGVGVGRTPSSNARRAPTLHDSESDSEYGGLAYADSDATDYEEDEFNSRRAGATPTPTPGGQHQRTGSSAPLSAAASILQRSTGAEGAPTRHMQFGSVSERSRSRSRSMSRDRERERVVGGRPREGSIASSSYSSTSSGANIAYRQRDSELSSVVEEARGRTETMPRQRQRTNSSAVAQALGLSQTPPSEYGRLGGPGILSRAASGSRSHSRTGSRVREGAADAAPVVAGGRLERSMTASSSGQSSDSGRPLVPASDSGRPLVPASASAPSMGARGYGYGAAEDDDEAVLGGAGGAKAQRSRTVMGTQSPEAALKPVKLPTRSLTSPSPKVSALGADDREREGVKEKEGLAASALVVGPAPKPKAKRRVCLKCSKVIEDGRWVSVDNGGVLCERCWKNMYLPKCRRCNLPIERAAVSSSDGQLKGKYHKECFNCFTCNKPFPDKTFYVYDGRALCAYHYHEANDSLCAAARCGQPIEGPCAVSHTGDRYHPEHMTCEHPGYPCAEQLTEYWEVDGRMLCERHALRSGNVGTDGSGSEGEDAEAAWVQSARAKKRVTRFIDLAGGMGGGEPGRL